MHLCSSFYLWVFEQSLPCSSSVCVLGPSGTARLPVSVCCFKGEKLLITIWMVKGLGMGFVSTSELTVPQVGSSSGRVLQRCLMGVWGRVAGILQDQVHGRSWEQWSLAAQPRSPSLLSCCRSLMVVRITFSSTAGLQTVVLGSKLISLGSAPLCRVWSLQTVNFQRHGLFSFPGNTNILALLQQSQLCKHWSDYLQNIWGRILLPKEWVAHKTCSV